MAQTSVRFFYILIWQYIYLSKCMFSRITALLRHDICFLEGKLDEIVQKKGEGC
jgi:hypothetical protein